MRLLVFVRVLTSDVLLHTLAYIDLWLIVLVIRSTMSINKSDLWAKVCSRLTQQCELAFTWFNIWLSFIIIFINFLSAGVRDVLLRLNLIPLSSKWRRNDVWSNIGTLCCVILNVNWAIDTWFGLFWFNIWIRWLIFIPWGLLGSLWLRTTFLWSQSRLRLISTGSLLFVLAIDCISLRCNSWRCWRSRLWTGLWHLTWLWTAYFTSSSWASWFITFWSKPRSSFTQCWAARRIGFSKRGSFPFLRSQATRWSLKRRRFSILWRAEYLWWCYLRWLSFSLCYKLLSTGTRWILRNSSIFCSFVSTSARHRTLVVCFWIRWLFLWG